MQYAVSPPARIFRHMGANEWLDNVSGDFAVTWQQGWRSYRYSPLLYRLSPFYPYSAGSDITGIAPYCGLACRVLCRRSTDMTFTDLEEGTSFPARLDLVRLEHRDGTPNVDCSACDVYLIDYIMIVCASQKTRLRKKVPRSPSSSKSSTGQVIVIELAGTSIASSGNRLFQI